MRPAEASGPPPTLFEVVHRAVEVTDPAGQYGLDDLLQHVENSDEPVTAHADIEEELAELKGHIDPQDEDPAAMMAIAVATYLAFRRDEMDDDPASLLRLAARAEYDSHPPDNVLAWLEEQGVSV
jgi:cell pole-organizing protein PopZ